MKNIGFVIMWAQAMAACSTSEIDTWEAMPQVWFTSASDTAVFSFYSQPEGTTEYTIELPVSLAGMVDREADRPLIVKDLGSRHSASEYEIVYAAIPAGEIAGAVRVKIKKTDNLAVAPDTIGFELCASDVFQLGLTESDWRTAIIVSNLLVKPDWWNSQAENHIGYYSETKMKVIYAVEGTYELFSSGASWSSDEVAVAIYKLNRYCKENNICYDNGNLVEFDFWTE